jgi:hypothetical protein
MLAEVSDLTNRNEENKMNRPATYTVVVSNLGIMYEGEDELCAKKSYNDYAKLSKDNVGIAAGEEVSLMKDGEIIGGYVPLKPHNETASEEYYKATEKIVMVPVKVCYHEATDIVYSFVTPTLEDIENALKNECSQCKKNYGEHSCGDHQVKGNYCSQCHKPGDYPAVSFGHGLSLHCCKDCVSAR